MINNMENKLRKIIDENIELTVPIEEIKLDDNLLNVGMDSLNTIRVIINIEEQFNLEFSDDDLIVDNFRTIRKLMDYLIERI
ncbi:hypothetical protein CIW83_05480 [Tissierella sp. P1]|uniref:phosphopantetheine-binding protein n=1 Tax=Tissierella sp. P1 TaxID=1280483 RepID=UPI000B9FD277|nr:phosphopantetheine-binding protein [Tissierella sp. P1]OZV12998.1 hypothetical protein CIW83_05480 [Tissierella sp. P1]